MRILTGLVTLLAASWLVQPRSGPLHFFLWLPKLLAVALSPLWALWSMLAVGVGWRRRDPLLLGLAAAGTAVTLKQLTAVTASQDAALAEAFGPDWLARIPVARRSRLSRRRWQPLVLGEPAGRVRRNVIYGVNSDAGKPLWADLLLPPSGTPSSGLALIFVHGGAWRFGRRNIDKFPYFRQLAAQGHLIMDIDYTLNPQTSVPGMVMDVKRAIIWLKANAAELQVDPERIVLNGQSAGGHLSLLAAYTPNYRGLQPKEVRGDTSVRAVISYYGPPDMVALQEDIAERFGILFNGRVYQRLYAVLRRVGEEDLVQGIAGLVGGGLQEIPDMYRLISPRTYVDSDCPPTLLLHGTHDLLVDHAAVKRLHEALRQAGVPVVHLPLPGCEHSFESILPRVSPAAQTAVYYMERFLALLEE